MLLHQTQPQELIFKGFSCVPLLRPWRSVSTHQLASAGQGALRPGGVTRRGGGLPGGTDIRRGVVSRRELKPGALVGGDRERRVMGCTGMWSMQAQYVCVCVCVCVHPMLTGQSHHAAERTELEFQVCLPHVHRHHSLFVSPSLRAQLSAGGGNPL